MFRHDLNFLPWTALIKTKNGKEEFRAPISDVWQQIKKHTKNYYNILHTKNFHLGIRAPNFRSKGCRLDACSSRNSFLKHVPYFKCTCIYYAKIFKCKKQAIVYKFYWYLKASAFCCSKSVVMLKLPMSSDKTSNLCYSATVIG